MATSTFPAALLGLAVALALALAPHAAASCTTDDDCGLLGDCVASSCVCDAGWVGDACASLDLAPAPLDSGLRQDNSSNWCGTILRDDRDADLYHSYNADFGGCTDGLAIWLTGSRVIHSTSRGSPLGPYTPLWPAGEAEVAVSAEAHNPQALRARDGTYLLMDSYDGPDADCALQANYSTCSSIGGDCKPKMPRNGGLGRFVYHYSSSPAGPWLPVNVSMDYPCYSENLTPSSFFHPNGTMFIVFHCDQDATHNTCDLVMVASNSWRGPFMRVNSRIWDSAGVSPHPEDPFAFLRTSHSGAVSYHIIVHNTPRGLHLYSSDGLNFTLQQKLDGSTPLPPFVFNETILQADGTSFAANRRERPWLLFARDSLQPEVLITSMQASVWPNVFTHAQLVRRQ